MVKKRLYQVHTHGFNSGITQSDLLNITYPKTDVLMANFMEKEEDNIVVKKRAYQVHTPEFISRCVVPYVSYDR